MTIYNSIPSMAADPPSVGRLLFRTAKFVPSWAEVTGTDQIVASSENGKTISTKELIITCGD